MTTHLLEFVVGSGSPNAHFNHAICFWAKIVQISILFAKCNRKEPHPRGSIMLFGCDDDTRCEVCYSVCPYRLIWSPTVAFKVLEFYLFFKLLAWKKGMGVEKKLYWSSSRGPLVHAETAQATFFDLVCKYREHKRTLITCTWTISRSLLPKFHEISIFFCVYGFF